MSKLNPNKTLCYFGALLSRNRAKIKNVAFGIHAAMAGFKPPSVAKTEDICMNIT
jgi:hypothetical protein